MIGILELRIFFFFFLFRCGKWVMFTLLKLMGLYSLNDTSFCGFVW